MRIQHNIMAMNAYRNYTNNTSALASNLEKLSSGYKINRAGDDAAGLAISEKMRAQITGLDVAQKNAKDGISLVQTAEGALTEVHDMLNRMVELASQSANGTYDNEVDRDNLQKEMDQLLEEIDRIADSANFNGINLLDGTMSETVVSDNLKDVAFGAAGLNRVNDAVLGKDAQEGIFSLDLSQLELINNNSTAGTGGAQTISVQIGSVKVTIGAAGSYSLDGGATLTGEALAELMDGQEIRLDGVTYTIEADGAKITLTGEEAPNTAIAADYELEIAMGGSISSNQGDQFAMTVEQEPIAKDGRVYAKAELDLEALNIEDGTTLKLGDTTYVFAVGKNSQYANMGNVIDLTDLDPDTISAAELARTAANRLSNVAKDNGTFYVGSKVGSGTITLTEKEGAIDYSKNNLVGVSSGDVDDATADDWAGLVQTGKVNAESSTNGLVLQIGDTSDSWNQLRVDIQDMHVSSLGIQGLDISVQGNAQAAIDKIKSAINTVSSVRGTLGATQNRLDHTINNLSVMEENIQDAESTIRDTDVAEEMMEYTKNNILIQSAQAMLAQANAVPQGVLQLLQ